MTGVAKRGVGAVLAMGGLRNTMAAIETRRRPVHILFVLPPLPQPKSSCRVPPASKPFALSPLCEGMQPSSLLFPSTPLPLCLDFDVERRFHPSRHLGATSLTRSVASISMLSSSSSSLLPHPSLSRHHHPPAPISLSEITLYMSLVRAASPHHPWASFTPAAPTSLRWQSPSPVSSQELGASGGGGLLWRRWHGEGHEAAQLAVLPLAGVVAGVGSPLLPRRHRQTSSSAASPR